MKNSLTHTGGIILLALSTTLACNKSSDTPAESPSTTLAPNNSYVTLSGTVVSAGADTFTMDYGTGEDTVLVELDDFDPLEEARALQAGDEVIVYGFVDDDFYERRSVEAGRVYVKNLNTTFYASSLDEEDFPREAWDGADSTISITGYVTDVNARQVTVRTAHQELTVDTKLMDRNPTDEVGYQQIEPGDRVYVVGWLTDNLFEGVEIQAENVVTIDYIDG